MFDKKVIVSTVIGLAAFGLIVFVLRKVPVEAVQTATNVITQK